MGPRRRSTGSNSGQWVVVPLIVYWAHSLNWAKAALYIFRIWGLLLRKWMWRRRWPRIGLLLPNCIIFDQVQGEVLWIKQWLVPFRSRRSKRSFSWTSGPHLSNQTGSGTWDGCGALPSRQLNILPSRQLNMHIKLPGKRSWYFCVLRMWSA